MKNKEYDVSEKLVSFVSRRICLGGSTAFITRRFSNNNARKNITLNSALPDVYRSDMPMYSCVIYRSIYLNWDVFEYQSGYFFDVFERP
jgi:hypothetical protein